LPRAGRMATVSVGDGDRLPRVAGRPGRVLVRGHAVGFAGRVCMDLVMLDVTEIADVREGDDVSLIGTQGGITQSADDLAAVCGTISYEILTGIRRRVPRWYFCGVR